ncbi:MAG: hypothetical protein JRJ86_15740 [Deltaproteobacteria bacterium]|nr:hypothetical protein [Deltaproteobacteria bacterium]
MKTLDEMKEKYPKVFNAVFDRGFEAGLAEGKALPGKISKEIEALKKNNQQSPTRERARRLWEGDEELQEEFRGNFETWAAYCKAEDEGRFRIAGRRPAK